MLLVLAFCGWMGIAFQNDMKDRIWMLQEFSRGILLLKQEITYLKFPLAEAVRHAGQRMERPVKDFFFEMGNRLEELEEASFAVVWEDMIKKCLFGTALKKEDLELICQLGQQLGQMECGEAEKVFMVYEQRLELALAGARETYKEKAQLYRRLGIMGGIFLVILLL